MKKVKILVVDDEAIVRESLSEWLKDVGYQVFAAESGPKALEVIGKEKPGIMIADLVMPGMDGIELMKRAKELHPRIEVIIITAYASIPTAIAAIKEGAYDYIEKPFCPERAEFLVEKLAEHQELVEENLALRHRLEDRYRFENIIAKSSKMQRLIELIKVVGKSNATVLITGESGTGKELVARAIHSQSHRRNKPFVAVSCAALPESLLESELFGHERGSFTGAYTRKKGKFEFASGGTLFLDEIGEMSANIQVHLLRVLEEKEFTRVGGNEPLRVDVRVISATNKDLRKAIEKQEFREDLYYRLNVVNIELPPLRERKEDIPLLAEHFLNKFASENRKEITGFSTDTVEFLLDYDWPGNVRELENAIERAVILAKDSIITIADLPQKKISPAYSTAQRKNLKEVEKEHILNILRETGENYSQAARILGISRMTLYKKAREYDLSVKKIKQ
ncbi:MAG: sigma-54-dependent Fis family transcriptional regulator [Dehalococcoidia bacterium]|nr:sigma-54-dependent Fis family transcriptional regulator [Dehalococcoidia bacterium]RLC62813.1 MAG: sigma-54-dependent Fis family transcriptional regulator [Chloroflexota bacterium]